VSLDVVGELGNVCVLCRVLSPVAGEFTFLLYAKERPNYKHVTLFSYMGKYGVQRRRVGGRLDGPCHDLAIMAYLVPEQWRLRG
jgi:hypothetical protein